jgi:hypothetical protein
MDDMLTRDWEMLLGRAHGPLDFRMIFQPTMAALLAIRAGLQDARAGRPPYGWTVLTQSGRRMELVRGDWKDVGRLFVAAVVIDIIYELMVFRWVYPGQPFIVAATLAVPPYLLIRGPANRIARHFDRWPHGSQREEPSKSMTISDPKRRDH